MIRGTIALALFACLALLAPWAAPAHGALAMPEAVASYRIRVRYDPIARTASGRAQVTWHNTSGEPVPDLQLHLYLNAFRNLKSSYMRERLVDDHRVARLLEGRWGWIGVRGLVLENGTDLTERIEFIAPDDGNPDDRTVARVALPRPVLPGDRLRFTVEFEARFPPAVDRNGWGKDMIVATQWFPKLGVYEPAGRGGRPQGGWNCHQFHAASEFFADFGDYDVVITVPDKWTVGATGERVGRHANVDGTVSHRFVQRGVHDFAWTASPRYEVHQRTFKAGEEVRPAELAAVAWELDRPVEDVRLPDVRVTVLAPAGEWRAVERAFRATFAAIKHYGLWYGPYPYDHLTVVIPPRDVASVARMEYPTLFFGSSSFLELPSFLSFESTIVHEFGHQYWYGLVASNEFEESWLDEGFNSYAQARVMDVAFGPRVARWAWSAYAIPGVEWHPLKLPWGVFRLEPPEGWKELKVPLFGVFGASTRLSDLARRRQRFLADPATDDVVRRAWEYRSHEVYRVNSYSRPAVILATLERLVGSPAWPRAMRAYAEEFRFKHPTTRDFLHTLGRVSGRDWGWFFDQFVWGHRRLDYAVAEVKSQEVTDEPGIYERDGEPVILDRRDVARQRRDLARQRKRAEKAGEVVPARYRSEVLVERRGDGVAPVELEVYFSDSTVAIERWDGRYQWARFRYDRPARVDSAVVDPAGALLIDTNRLNNTRASDPGHVASRRWTIRWMLWVQSFLQIVGWLA